jgi:hypothetical protein
MTPPLIELDLVAAPASLHAGERGELTLAVRRAAQAEGSVRLRQVRCNDRNISLDVDLFERDLTLQPGESYQLAVGLLPAAPGTLRLDDVRVQAEGEHYGLPQQAVPIHPSLRREVSLDVEPICTYEQGTRVLIRLRHTGSLAFDDVDLRIEPAHGVQAGKAILRCARFVPGQVEQEEVVLVPGLVTLHVAARLGADQAQMRQQVDIPATLPRDRGKAFRFLEARRLSVDHVELRPLDPDDAPPVQPVQGVYAVCGKQHYRVVVRPSDPAATKVQLRELAEQVHVSPIVRALKGRWEFQVFIPANAVWTHPARLLYDVETGDGPQIGEIHLSVQPPRWKRALVAATVGAAITLQSATLLFSALFGRAPDWERVLAQFNPANGLQARHFYQLASIPLVWFILYLADRVQYRWRT